MATASTPIYVPPVPPATTTPEGQAVVDWAMQQFEHISRSFLDATALELRPIYAPPPNPRAGMIVYADGTSWNPGSGQGVYRYSLAGTWVFLG
jgi:hypothetical protein